ncbi:S1/P1 nuclease [Luteimonas sp. FCS-9]|uniref:S1/P1 nuclease n=1 Tax=Luteimonas sp. FCS-9 TaxID=1547516 RepID=UPI00063E9759|nr:S1/P1 nuclease [Luteimonas sp. FCS-9]KLJ00973.1 endonuclease [Luteimonas sp. FCS-9]
MRRPVLLFCLLALAAASPSAFAWGKLGHRLVAQLAERDLTPQARAQVDALLAGEPEPTLGGIASWADELRERDPDLGRRSAKWHYVNIGESGCRYDPARDCPGGDCVVEAIKTQTAILADRARPRAERAAALKFVVHFVGDVHQPMHAGYAHDKGGNTHQINHRGRGTNLHAFWDSGMLNAAGRSDDAWLADLQALPPPAPDARLLPPAAQDWAQAACRIAVAPGVYPVRGRLGEDYVAAQLPTVERQLRDAGTRLGALLNAALATPAP